MEKSLISFLPKNQTFDFYGQDSERIFKMNLKKFKKTDWIYKNKPITYKFNEHGFRNKSFDKVDWSNSIVVLGCSNVQGIGLSLEDTLCYHLEKKLNTPVVNLGIGGSAVDLACWNSLQLHNYYPKPKALIQVWTSLGRYTDYNNNQLNSYLPQFGYNYYHKLNWPYRSSWYIEADRALWKNKLIYVESSFFSEKYFDQKNIKKLKTLDKARDCAHPGIESNLIAAETIKDLLLNQGF